MTLLKILFIAVLLVVQTILLWGIFVLVALVYRAFMRQIIRRRLHCQNKIVAWNSIEDKPNEGVIWLNKSTRHFCGLRLWWIPTYPAKRKIGLFMIWYQRGLLINEQELDLATISTSGHQVVEFDDF